MDRGRYLVTTADERTWPQAEPILFLGEWCRKYARRQAWETLDGVVAEPYGVGRAARDRDHAIVRDVGEALFPTLCGELDRIHEVNHGVRFWRIVLGHWLARYVNVVFNRYQTLATCFERYAVSAVSVLSSDIYHLATTTSEGLVWASDDDVWNSFLDARILRFLPAAHLCVTPVRVNEGEGFRLPERQPLASAKLRLRSHVVDAVEAVTNIFVRDRDAFVINSYLPRSEEAKVQLRLGQVPKVWRTPTITIRRRPDRHLRDSLVQRRLDSGSEGVVRCIEQLMFELLPVCFLEGLTDLQHQTERFPWPATPKFIFTSNSSDTDEGFKYWAARKAERGVPYYTGQHGNNYGTHRYLSPAVEERVADKFFTWGWTDGLPQHTAAFIFKTAGVPAPTTNPGGGLLLSELCVGHRITAWDSYADFVKYFEDQKSFVEALNPEIRSALTIRFHGTYKRLGWSEALRWRDFDPTLRLDTGTQLIRKVIGEHRLVVHSYDSTGILEGLAWNIPTVAFWQEGFDHLRESAIPWYQLLVDAGIVHLSVESAAAQVNAVWNDVAGWWQSDPVQSARRQFCDRYARSTDTPARDFVQLALAPSLARGELRWVES